MLSRTHVISFVGLTIGAWLLALWVQGTPVLTLDFLRPFAVVVGTVFGVVTFFSKWAWSWKTFRGWFVNRPDVRGTWKVELQSGWIDLDTKKGIPPIQAFAAIRQTLTTLSIRLMTPESKSILIAHSIELGPDGIFRIAGIYRNEPKVELQGVQSEIHHGSILLEVYGTPPSSVEGHYWTDRNTRGQIIFTQNVKEIYNTYTSANSAYNN